MKFDEIFCGHEFAYEILLSPGYDELPIFETISLFRLEMVLQKTCGERTFSSRSPSLVATYSATIFFHRLS